APAARRAAARRLLPAATRRAGARVGPAAPRPGARERLGALAGEPSRALVGPRVSVERRARRLRPLLHAAEPRPPGILRGARAGASSRVAPLRRRRSRAVRRRARVLRAA